jgi:kynurenine formamidase
MKSKKTGIIILGIALAAVFFIGIRNIKISHAGPAEGLLPEKWWPSKWGADDEKGSFNLITPERVKASLKLVKTGKIYRLSKPYDNKIPLPWGRTYTLLIPGLPTLGNTPPFGKQGAIWNDEFIVGELGQVGTQYDGLGHTGMTDKNGVRRWYNGVAYQEKSWEHAHGLKKNGVEKQGPCITRGVLIDAAGLKGVKTMKTGELITVQDIETCIKKAGIAPIGEGDAVFFNTGWIEHWLDAKTFNSGCPGVSIEALKYLVKKNVALVGADTWPALDPVPVEDPDYPFIAHCYLECVNGIGQLQNLDLRELAKDRVYEFLCVFVPVPFAGATGSPSDTLAIQ